MRQFSYSATQSIIQPTLLRTGLLTLALLLSGLSVALAADNHQELANDRPAFGYESDSPELDQAIRHFRKAERCKVNSNERAEGYASAERIAESILDQDGNNAQAHFLLFAARGRVLLDDGVQMTEMFKLADLRKHLARTLELDPNHPQALAAKGGLLIDLPAMMGGNVDEGVRLLERALELNPFGVGTHITLAKALAKQGANKRALELLNTAGHYACLKRRLDAIEKVDTLLEEIASGRGPSPHPEVLKASAGKARRLSPPATQVLADSQAGSAPDHASD